jgi:hypothetical protein
MRFAVELCRPTIPLGTLLVLIGIPSRADACSPPELLGRVKSVIVSEVLVDSTTGKVAGVREVLRIDVSQDGAVAKTTLALSGRSAGPPATSTTYFENGRPVRALQTVNGKTVPSMTCSYDSQGRLVASRTGSENTEFGITETYEYGPAFVRRRTSVLPSGGPSLTAQTLDANGRVVKEVVVDEATSTVQRTSEVTYEGDRKQVCEVSSRDARRQCVTTVEDSHGNEIEVVAEGRTRKMSSEYDAAGNWISKRTSVSGPIGMIVVTIEQRKIEYGSGCSSPWDGVALSRLAETQKLFIGQVTHFGFRALQWVAPKSISA